MIPCPLVTAPGQPDLTGVAALRADLRGAAASDPVALSAVMLAFPTDVLEADHATVYAVPFLLDPIRALRANGHVPAPVAHACAHVVAAFLLGVACRVCGGDADAVARHAVLGLSLPPESKLRALLPSRSAAQDAVAAGGVLLDGVCDCNPSSPRGAEADALAGMA